MRRIAVGETGRDALMIIGIRGVPQMKKKGRHFTLFSRGKGCDALLDLLNIHGTQTTAGSVGSKRAKSPGGYGIFATSMLRISTSCSPVSFGTVTRSPTVWPMSACAICER